MFARIVDWFRRLCRRQPFHYLQTRTVQTDLDRITEVILSYWEKARASRPSVYQATALATSSTVSNKFSAQTYQIRVNATQPVWLTVGDSSSVTASTTGGSLLINSGTAPEYLAVTPGQFAAFLTTSATTGWFSLTEMA